MASFRIFTYVRREGSGYQVSASTLRADLERSVPLTDGASAFAPDRDTALRVRGELVAELIAQMRQRGDEVVQIRELGDVDR